MVCVSLPCYRTVVSLPAGRWGQSEFSLTVADDWTMYGVSVRRSSRVD